MERIQAENNERIVADIDEILAHRSSAPSSVVSSRTDVSGRDNDESLSSDDASRASRNESSPSSRHVRFEEEEKEELTPQEERRNCHQGNRLFSLKRRRDLLYLGVKNDDWPILM